MVCWTVTCNAGLLDDCCAEAGDPSVLCAGHPQQACHAITPLNTHAASAWLKTPPRAASCVS